jgi:hypothetical protein
MMAKEDKEKRAKTESDTPKKSALETKADAIRRSKMPESQKIQYLQEIGFLPKTEQKGVPFSVYAKVRKISKWHHSAMCAYPGAQGISLATLKEWDEIFKNF